MKLRRYLEKGQNNNSVCLMSIINIKMKTLMEMKVSLDKIPEERKIKKRKKIIQKRTQQIEEIYDFNNDLEYSKVNQKNQLKERDRSLQQNKINTVQNQLLNIKPISDIVQIKEKPKEYINLPTINNNKLFTKSIEIKKRQLTTEKPIYQSSKATPNIMKFNQLPIKNPSQNTSKISIKQNNKLLNSFSPLIKTKQLIIKNQKLKYLLRTKDKKLLTLCLSNRINWEPSDDKKNYNFIWKYANKSAFFKSLKNNEKSQSFNHFEYHYEISNKKLFFMNLYDFCSKNDINPFKFIPFTVILTNERSSLSNSLKSFKELFNSIELFSKLDKNNDFTNNDTYDKYFSLSLKESILNKVKIIIPNSFLSNKNLWIIKPDNLCQGKLIQLIDSPDELTKLMRKYFNQTVEENIKVDQKSDKKPKNHIFFNVILQKYIEKPLLFNGRKFDIRVFLLLDQNLNLFILKEGYLKTCSNEYNLDTKEPLIHITNYSLQKKSPDFCKHEYGNELSFMDFQNMLDKSYPGTNVYNDIMPKIKSIIKFPFFSVANKINKNDCCNTFELYGCDIILDNNFNPFILEINDNPGLSISSPVIEVLFPRMLDDMFRLTIDEIYPTINNDYIDGKYNSRFAVPGYSNSENLFEFLCNIKQP